MTIKDAMQSHRTPSPSFQVEMWSSGAVMPQCAMSPHAFSNVASALSVQNPAPNASQPMSPSGVVCVDVQS